MAIAGRMIGVFLGCSIVGGFGWSCSSSQPPPEIGETEEAATTAGHQSASQYASDNSCAWLMVGDGSAEVWGVDPAC